MNDQGPKNIFFNKSSLLGLKAELLKKQEEVLAKKQQPQHKVSNFKPPPAKSVATNVDSKEPKKTFKDGLKAIDVEELEACKKSKAALEKKAELYEHLSDAAGSSQLAERFLVDFSLKKQQEAVEKLTESDDEEYNQDSGDEEWTEFTDCLGRTRKCLKSDLHLYQQKNDQLSREVFKKSPSPEPESKPPDTTVKEKPLLVQKTNDYLQTLRQKWEEKERDLLARDKDIHYQDLLFDEARQHGVGYYAFSTVESERQKQMEELAREREKTLGAQRESAEARKRREELMAARVAAARARQRARAGLPPETPQDTSKDFTACLMEFLNKQKDEAEAEAKEKERKIREEKEKQRQQLREAYVREWDIGKDGVEGKGKKFVEMTQEEYIEQQRSKRIDEFAPPSFADDGKSRKPLPQTKTWEQVRPPMCPSPPRISEDDEVKGLYFSTIASKASSKNNTKFSNFVGPQTSKSNTGSMAKSKTTESYQETCASNLVNSHNSTDEEATLNNKNDAQFNPLPLNTFDYTTSSKDNVNKPRMKYRNLMEYQKTTLSMPVEIVNEVEETCSEEVAQLPVYDDDEPVPKKQKNPTPFTSDIHEAYAQGLKRLGK